MDLNWFTGESKMIRKLETRPSWREIKKCEPAYDAGEFWSMERASDQQGRGGADMVINHNLRDINLGAGGRRKHF